MEDSKTCPRLPSAPSHLLPLPPPPITMNRCLDFFRDLTEAQAELAMDEFSQSDIESIRNKSAFLMSILRCGNDTPRMPTFKAASSGTWIFLLKIGFLKKKKKRSKESKLPLFIAARNGLRIVNRKRFLIKSTVFFYPQAKEKSVWDYWFSDELIRPTLNQTDLYETALHRTVFNEITDCTVLCCSVV